MNLEVGNVSCTGAVISWSSSEPCLEEFYHVAYRPSWRSLFSGYLRYSPQHEEKVPRAVSSLALRRLAPATLYFLCISCRRAGAEDRHHCTMFHTLAETPPAPASTLQDPQLSLWVLLAVLLAGFTLALAFICLQFWCVRYHEPRWAYQVEEANRLVWGPEPGQRDEDPQDLPLAEMERLELDPAAAEADAEAGVNQEGPGAGASAQEGLGAPWANEVGVGGGRQLNHVP